MGIFTQQGRNFPKRWKETLWNGVQNSLSDLNAGITPDSTGDWMEMLDVILKTAEARMHNDKK